MTKQSMIRINKDTKQKLLTIKINKDLKSIDAVIRMILTENKRKDDQINSLLNDKVSNQSNDFRR